jgi:type III secretion protein D
MFELRVLTGLHQGAALPLVGEQWLIGSDAEQDLALHDPGVEQLHCRLQRLGDSWTLNAEQGAIRDDEGHALPITELTPNAAFVLGSVWLCVSPAEDAWPSVPAVIAPEPQRREVPKTEEEPAHTAPPLEKVEARSRVLNRTTGIVIGLLIGIAGSAWGLTRSASSGPELAVAQVTTASSGQPPAKADAPARTAAKPLTSKRIQLADTEETRRQLNTMLSERLLSDVNVQVTPEGLALSGNLKEESLLVYQRMLQRFKDRYDSPIALIDNVSTSRTGLPFVIVQIMSGPHAHLVTADGHRLYIGDELEGLRLTRIDDKRISFDGDRKYEVNW